MDALKALVQETQSKAKQGWKRAADSDDSDGGPPAKKYVRRGEKAAAMRAEEDAIHEADVLKKKKANTAVTKVDDEEDDDDEEDVITPDDVKHRLRGMSQPITLFGESNKQRLSRYKELELLIAEKHGGSMGTGHELQAIIAAEVDNEIMQATLAAMEGGNEQEETPETRKLAAKKARMLARRHDKYKEMKKREAFDKVEDFLIFFFKRILLVWEEELNARPDEEKSTMRGKTASATQKQTRSYLKPFFNMLKKNTCPADVVKHTESIVTNCIKREYVWANVTYLKMSIGNAAWPMGVTSVGIHERAGREKISNAGAAHILNNETSRKYIQGMKRIMTFCQHAYPNVPSKMVI